MTRQPESPKTFVWRICSAHVIAYFTAGVFALLFLDYRTHFSSESLALLMRPVSSPWVALGPGLQIFRGVLIALALLPVRGFLYGKNGFLKLAGSGPEFHLDHRSHARFVRRLHLHDPARAVSSGRNPRSRFIHRALRGHPRLLAQIRKKIRHNALHRTGGRNRAVQRHGIPWRGAGGVTRRPSGQTGVHRM